MAWTSHGYQIPGTPVEGERPPVARCGGIRLCSKCKDEVAQYNAASFPVSAKDFVLEPEVPMAFATDNGGNPDQYFQKAKELVIEKYNRDILDFGDTEPLREDEVFIVWFSKTLQNWKALLSTDRFDGRYYELTYNGDRLETYIDVYKKISNEAVSDLSR